MKNFIHIIVFLSIIFFAVFLRFYKLGEVPVGPNWDEAALGYNAYSILKTGKDEYGERFPLSLRSYDDYKPPLYMYLTVPSVALFDLNLWSTRLPAAVNGVIAVIGVFFLIKTLSVYNSVLKRMRWLPYFSAFFLAISPWHVHFSRVAFEANIGVTLNIWGVTFLLLGLKRSIMAGIGGCLFGLSLYAYHSQRIFMPLLVILFFVIFLFHIENKKRFFITFCIAFSLVVLPLIPVFMNPNTLTRFRGTSSIADTTGLLKNTVQRLERNKESNNFLGLVLDNRRFVYAKTILDGYLSHFSLRWLFIDGDNARHHAPGMGLLYHVELPLIFVGLLFLIRYGKRIAIFVLGWMVIAPIAASPTTELPHAIRTLVFLPTFQILSAIGILFVFSFSRFLLKPFRLGFFIIVAFVGFLNFSYFLSSYFVQQNYEYSKFWQYGYKQVVDYVIRHYNQYRTIIVSTKLEQPHMFFLFHLRYDPALYLAQGGTASGGFAETRNAFDKFQFRPIHWEREIKDGSILYIGSPSEIPNSIHTIYYLDGQEAIHIAS
ncbi:MAG: hypothetical protein N3A54_06090 [Patescibacteria group bacterium]|nr:hypothetical protein [Patescibacteria group bacterium]